MTKELPEALRLAAVLEVMATIGDMGRGPDPKDKRRKAAVELRRLHERNAELERVLGVARTTIDRMKDTETYQSDEDECGSYVCCDHISYKGHKEDCHAVNAIATIDAILAKKENT